MQRRKETVCANKNLNLESRQSWSNKVPRSRSAQDSVSRKQTQALGKASQKWFQALKGSPMFGWQGGVPDPGSTLSEG